MGNSERVLLRYDGLQHDSLALARERHSTASESAIEELDVTIFTVESQQGRLAFEAAGKLVSRALCAGKGGPW